MQHSLTTETYRSLASKAIHRILQTRSFKYTNILSRKPPPPEELRSTEPMHRQRDTQRSLTKSSAMVQLSA